MARQRFGEVVFEILDFASARAGSAQVIVAQALREADSAAGKCGRLRRGKISGTVAVEAPND
jgi:hypothetical protein